ncbi:MAG: DNA polymerase III subunit beta [Chloroflexota bacterium]|nr:DNA polymerase III subunit beta [Chloroflexota bacterium]
MKLVCIQEDLSRALGIVSRVTPKKSELPITQNILLSAKDSMLKVTGTDLKTTITTWIEAQVEEDGDITAPATLLTNLVKTLPSEAVEIESTDTPIGVHIKCEGQQSNISGVHAEDFPAVPSIDEGIAATIETAVLKQAADRVAFAASEDDLRAVLSGVKAVIKGDTATFIATDGFRLSVHTCKLAKALSEDIEFLVRARAMKEMGRILNGEGVVEFMVTDDLNHALFRIGDVEIISTLISGAFPDYEKLIPSNITTKAVVNTDEFLRAVKTASIFAAENHNIIRLKAGEKDNGRGCLTLSSQASQVGDNTGEIEASITGNDAKIAFDSRFLVDVLGILDGDITMEMSDPTKPCVLRTATEDNDFAHIMMPMFVQW